MTTLLFMCLHPTPHFCTWRSSFCEGKHLFSCFFWKNSQTWMLPQSVQVFHENFVLYFVLAHSHCVVGFICPFPSSTVHPSVRSSINPSINYPRTETQVQLYCPVYGEHAINVFVQSLVFMRSLHILTPVFVVSTVSCLYDIAMPHSKSIFILLFHCKSKLRSEQRWLKKIEFANSNSAAMQKVKHLPLHCHEINPDIILKA